MPDLSYVLYWTQYSLFEFLISSSVQNSPAGSLTWLSLGLCTSLIHLYTNIYAFTYKTVVILYSGTKDLDIYHTTLKYICFLLLVLMCSFSLPPPPAMLLLLPYRDLQKEGWGSCWVSIDTPRVYKQWLECIQMTGFLCAAYWSISLFCLTTCSCHSAFEV